MDGPSRVLEDIWVHKQVFLQKTRHVVWNAVLQGLDQKKIQAVIRKQGKKALPQNDHKVSYLPFLVDFEVAAAEKGYMGKAELDYIREYVTHEFASLVERLAR